MAYYRDAKKWHPDMNPNNRLAKEQFQNLNGAYQLLIDDRRRAEFDQLRHGCQPASDSSMEFHNHPSMWDNVSDAFPFNHGKRWHAADEAELARMHLRGLSVAEISKRLGRTYGATKSRLKMNGLL